LPLALKLWLIEIGAGVRNAPLACIEPDTVSGAGTRNPPLAVMLAVTDCGAGTRKPPVALNDACSVIGCGLMGPLCVEGLVLTEAAADGCAVLTSALLADVLRLALVTADAEPAGGDASAATCAVGAPGGLTPVGSVVEAPAAAAPADRLMVTLTAAGEKKAPFTVSAAERLMAAPVLASAVAVTSGLAATAEKFVALTTSSPLP